MGPNEIINHRKNKFLSIGRNKGFASTNNENDSLISKKTTLADLKNKYLSRKFLLILSSLLLFTLIYIFL